MQARVVAISERERSFISGLESDTESWATLRLMIPSRREFIAEITLPVVFVMGAHTRIGDVFDVQLKLPKQVVS